MDLNTARLRAFVVTAEELSFTRAARRLHMAQQALSASIARLERDVGVQLFHRSTRSVELTAAGRAFVPLARRALHDIDAAIATARRIERTARGLVRVGAMAGAALELTDPILDAFAASHPEVVVELEPHLYDDPSAGLREGSTDVAFVRPPFDARGLEVVELVTEPIVAVVGRRHRLARSDRLTRADLATETMVRPLSPDPAWNRFWSGDGISQTELGARTLEEALELVAAGRAVSLAAAGWVRFAPRRGVVPKPVSGLERSVLAVATRAGRSADPVHRAFVTIARSTVAAERELVALIERGRP